MLILANTFTCQVDGNFFLRFHPSGFALKIRIDGKSKLDKTLIKVCLPNVIKVKINVSMGLPPSTPLTPAVESQPVLVSHVAFLLLL